MATARSSSWVLTRDGRVMVWGAAGLGIAGDGDLEHHVLLRPRELTGITGVDDVCGGADSFVARRGEELLCWGRAARTTNGVVADPTDGSPAVHRIAGAKLVRLTYSGGAILT